MDTATVISIVTCGAAFVSAIASICSIISTTKSNRFNAYFTKKSDAYSTFIHEFSKLYFSPTDKITTSLAVSFSAAYYQACLFAPESVYKRLSELVNSVNDDESKSKIFVLYNDSLDAMKADLQATESGKLFKNSHFR